MKSSHVTALSLLLALFAVITSCGPPAPIEYQPLGVFVDQSRTEVLNSMGSEPSRYVWSGEEYTADALPLDMYIMDYPDIDFMINNSEGTHLVREIRIQSALYRCLGGLTVGLTPEETFVYLGEPAETRDGVELTFEEDVFYRNANGTEGYHYYNSSAHGIRLFFSDGVNNVVYIYGSDVEVEARLE